MTTLAPQRAPAQPLEAVPRPAARGKFLYRGTEKLYVRGVTYGTFGEDADGDQYGTPEVVDRDFALMAANGINAVRTYTVPPRWLLDLASERDLLVMVGLPWEQHVAFLDLPGRAAEIEQRVRKAVRRCAGHPAVLAYAVGNEIPSSIVRWHGARRVERFLRRLGASVREEDPGALVSYVNFPSTEYLDLSWADFLCFNVYLEDEERLRSYLARLQNLSGDRPLLMAEIGLDSRRNGLRAQADALEWQVRVSFAAGVCGAFVFAWTDEWHRGGHRIEDWDFGLTDRERRPKPALARVRAAFAEVPFAPGRTEPRVSVVVCTRDGAATLRDCLEGLDALVYPDVEVIVVDDGSTDESARIAAEYDVRVISTPNRGLSAARNTGLAAASGEIVAYLDDDARPDPHWLTYLVATFQRTGHAAVGGPNIAPAGDGPLAACVANAPGGPIHVLVTDDEAEHVPGCNMAFRRRALEALGGFDPRFRTAGDDVDVCWRLLDSGGTIGFSPAAMVWHHRRNSLRAYLKQQRGYGRAEALLEHKWPERYNAEGHLSWRGRLYGRGVSERLGRRWRIYYGTWGSGLFQSVYERSGNPLAAFALMPEWFAVIAVLALASALGLLWAPLLAAAPLLLGATGAVVLQAAGGGRRAVFADARYSAIRRLGLHALTALLHLLQPLARLEGRLRHGLSPFRGRGLGGFGLPWPRTSTIWDEEWMAGDDRLRSLEARLGAGGAAVLRGGDFDRWDLEVRGGTTAVARARMVVEEHGGGRQLVRLRAWPRFSPGWCSVAVLLAVLAVAAVAAAEPLAAGALGLLAALLAGRAVFEAGAATALLATALEEEAPTPASEG